jgi:hypothetical protein
MCEITHGWTRTETRVINQTFKRKTHKTNGFIILFYTHFFTTGNFLGQRIRDKPVTNAKILIKLLLCKVVRSHICLITCVTMVAVAGIIQEASKMTIDYLLPPSLPSTRHVNDIAYLKKG